MHRFAQTRQLLLDALSELEAEGAIPFKLSRSAITVDLPRETGHGDMASNAAMVLAKPAGMAPKDIAHLLQKKLKHLPEVESVEIAGPGFLNMRFRPVYWQRLVGEILTAGDQYGRIPLGENRKVNVEYVSANPTGPIHVGHARGAVYGDALASVLAYAGYDVTREYYVNDAGAQIDKVAESAFLRYREAHGQDIGEIPAGLYPGDYLIPVGQALKDTFGKELLTLSPDERNAKIRPVVIDSMLDLIKEDLARIGIKHDRFVSEAALTAAGRVEEALALLESKDLIYIGTLEPPKGKAPEDWEPRPQTLFKSTAFGDDVDRALKKSDGSWTYFAPDVAYHLDKIRRGFEMLIDVFGADHGGYVKRIQAVVTALSDGKVETDIKLCQLVKLLRNGEPAKMSKRAGTLVTVREIVDEVGPDVFRFTMLTRKNDAPLDFDFDKVVEQSKENPVFYVQYAHARIHSVLRHAGADHPTLVERAKAPEPALLGMLTEPAELALIRRMAYFPRLIESAALAHEPHRVAFYLGELAGEFHALWNLGQDKAELRFILPKLENLTAARLALISACANVLAAGLKLLGVEPLKELRA